MGVVITEKTYRCGPTCTAKFCKPSSGRTGNFARSIDAYNGVKSRTSCPAACRNFVRAEDTSARPPVLDSGAASDARRQTLRFIGGLPVYDVAPCAAF